MPQPPFPGFSLASLTTPLSVSILGSCSLSPLLLGFHEPLSWTPSHSTHVDKGALSIPMPSFTNYNLVLFKIYASSSDVSPELQAHITDCAMSSFMKISHSPVENEIYHFPQTHRLLLCFSISANDTFIHSRSPGMNYS